MSLYIGKDDNNNSIMHITEGTTGTDLMKNGTILNTVFHSSLPYLSISVYDCGPVTQWVHSAPWCCETTTGSKVLVPKEARDLWNAGKKVIISADGVMTDPYPWSQSYYTTHAMWMPSVSSDPLLYMGSSYASPSDSNPVLAIPGHFSSVTLYVIDNIINSNGYTPLPQPSDSIYIDNSTISVNGINLSDFIFISSSTLNSIDDVLKLNFRNSNTVQVINSRNTYSSLEFSSSIAGSTISKGNYLMYDSNNKSKFKYQSFFEHSWPYGKFTGGPYENVLGENHIICTSSQLAPGDLFTFEMLDNSTGNTTNFFTVFEYQENTELAGVINHHQRGAYRIHAWLFGGTNGGLYISFYGSFGGGTLYSHGFTFRVNIFKD
jgi:hypothetical protein